MAYYKSEHGKFYTGPSLNGPWQMRELTESRQRPQTSRKKARPHKEKIMGKSRFDRSLEEKRRRRLREGEDVPFDLDDDEFDEVLAEVKRYRFWTLVGDSRLTPLSCPALRVALPSMADSTQRRVAA